MPTTQLTRTVALLYRMESADIRDLEAQLLEARKRAWSNALTEEATRHGCNRRPNAPRLADLTELRRMSREDAQSIAKTYNTAVEREIERLYGTNPRGNRQYYFANLERWSRQRESWKLQQIALNTELTARQYARDQFARRNNIGGRWKFVGAPPVCKICTRLYGMGYVTRDRVEYYGHSQHIGCPHEWVEVQPSRLDCRDLWLG